MRLKYRVAQLWERVRGTIVTGPVTPVRPSIRPCFRRIRVHRHLYGRRTVLECCWLYDRQGRGVKRRRTRTSRVKVSAALSSAYWILTIDWRLAGALPLDDHFYCVNETQVPAELVCCSLRPIIIIGLRLQQQPSSPSRAVNWRLKPIKQLFQNRRDEFSRPITKYKMLKNILNILVAQSWVPGTRTCIQLTVGLSQ